MIRGVLINGVDTRSLDVMDRGLHYGDGLFETLRVVEGEVPLWAQHWHRLQAGCQRLHLSCPDEDVLLNEIRRIINTIPHAVLKLILTRGPGERGYAFPTHSQTSRILIASDYPAYPAAYWQDGIRVFSCQTPLGLNPALAGLKHLNRLEQVLARNEWQGTDYQEGLVCDIEGNVIEGTMSNVFWLKDNQLYTPELTRCGVAGVMREIVIQLAQAKGFSTMIGSWSPAVLREADEIFLTNSLIGIWPVSYILNTTRAVGPVTQKLQTMLQADYAF